MEKHYKYDISNTGYSKLMDEKTTQYNNLVTRAELTARANGGKPSKEEGLLYIEAAKVCAQIRDMNTDQRSVYAQWQLRQQSCEGEARRIADALAPRPKPAPIQTDDSQKGTENYQRNSAPDGREKKVPQDTKTGFTTKNACKDVSAETIESWYKDMPNHGLDDVAGMEDLKQRLMEEAGSIGWERIDKFLKISPVQCYFFYGPAGTGKTFLITAFAQQMMKDQGFKFIQLMGSDIHASLVGVAEKTVRIAFQEAEDNAPCFIFIDEIENVCVARDDPKVEGHEKRLTVAFLEAYNKLRDSGKRVIFMGATNHPCKVDGAMLDRVKMIEIPLPTRDARESYFQRKFKDISLEEGFSFGDMADATEDYSYRDMDRITDTIFIRTKKKAIEEYQVLSASGALDQDRTDLAGSEALEAGELKVTRELFEQVKRELPPSDKTAIRVELEEFRRRIKGME